MKTQVFQYQKSYHLSLLKSILDVDIENGEALGAHTPLTFCFLFFIMCHAHTSQPCNKSLHQSKIRYKYACGVVDTIYELLSFWFT